MKHEDAEAYQVYLGLCRVHTCQRSQICRRKNISLIFYVTYKVRLVVEDLVLAIMVVEFLVD